MSKKILHKEVYQYLVEGITKGTFKEGDLLPSENVLCGLFNITRPTVRVALSRLAGEGYIFREHGRGSVVLGPKNGLGILSIEGTSSGLKGTSLETKMIGIPLHGEWPENPHFSIPSEVLEGPCVHMERIRSILQKPILYEKTYFAAEYTPHFQGLNLSNQSLFKTLKERYGIEVLHGEQKIWAVVADTALCELLEVTPSTPLLHLERKIYTNKKHFHIFSSLYCHTDTYYLQGSF